MNRRASAPSPAEMRPSFAPLAALVVLAGCGTAPPRPVPAKAAPEAAPVQSYRRILYGDAKADMVPKRTRVFALTRRCAQGPFEFTIDPLGGEFSEYVDVTIHGGKAMTGRWEFKGGGYAGVTSSVFYTLGADNQWVKEPDNAFCKLEPPPAPAPSASGKPKGTPPPPAPGGGGGAGGGSGGSGGGGGKVDLVLEVPAPKVKLPPNAKFTVHFDITKPPSAKVDLTVWSEVALDFGDDAYIVVEQGVYVPVDVPAWKAEVDKKIAEREASKKKSAETSVAVNLCFKNYYATKAWPDDCRKLAGDLPEREARNKACWEVWKAKKQWSDACRKEFGDGPDPKGGAAKGSTVPVGKPPPPPAETPPPKPSENAVWVSGSFTWHTSWVWSPGTWKVPKKDVDEGKTAKAPSAAPAPKKEAPPPAPAPGMVWTEGHWFFAVEGWIWIGGAWRMPPSPGAKWKVTTYVSIGGGWVLVPGGWSE